MIVIELAMVKDLARNECFLSLFQDSQEEVTSSGGGGYSIHCHHTILETNYVCFCVRRTLKHSTDLGYEITLSGFLRVYICTCQKGRI